MKNLITLHDADEIAAESAAIERLGLARVILGILRQPSHALAQVFERPFQGYALLLAGAGGIYWLLNLSIAAAMGGSIPLPLLLLSVAVIGVAAGLAYLYALTILIDWACDILGGNATRRQIRMLLACAGIPGLLALLVTGIPRIILFGESLFLPERAWMAASPVLVWGLWFGDAVAFAWSALLVVKGLKIMNGFSTARAMGAAVLPVAPIALLGGFFLLMMWAVLALAPPAF